MKRVLQYNSFIPIILSLLVFLCINQAQGRRTKAPLIFISAATIESNVSEWGDCGLPVAIILDIDGNILLKPLKVVKKDANASAFYRHLACKLLGDFFISQGVYDYEHIPIPITLGDGVYYYIYSEGLSHYPLEFQGREIILAEWDSFNSAFKEAGFFPDKDIVWQEDHSLSNNIIVDHLLSEVMLSNPGKITDWMRIDFEFFSFPSPLSGALISNELWDRFVSREGRALEDSLGADRFELLNICVGALKNSGRLSGSKEDRFNQLFSEYQASLLKGYFGS